MKYYLPLLLGLAVAFAGCNTATQVGKTATGPQVKPSLMLMPADQAHYYAPPGRLDPDPTTTEPAPANSTDTVTTPAAVEAYPVARYIDPANKNLMHERHVVYRRTAPKWKLQAPPSQQITVGQPLTSQKAENPIYTQEADSFLADQRAINGAVQQTLETVVRATKELQEAELARRKAEAAAEPKKPTAPATETKVEKPAEQSSTNAPTKQRNTATAGS